MDLDKVEIVNFRAFGEKVKAWAKGTDSVPATIQEFAEQLGAANVGAKIPDRLTRIRFVQDDEETLTVRLPCRRALETAETRLASEGGSYPLPAFYERVFGAEPKVNDVRGFHAERIGDYSIAMCA